MKVVLTFVSVIAAVTCRPMIQKDPRVLMQDPLFREALEKEFEAIDEEIQGRFEDFLEEFPAWAMNDYNDFGPTMEPPAVTGTDMYPPHYDVTTEVDWWELDTTGAPTTHFDEGHLDFETTAQETTAFPMFETTGATEAIEGETSAATEEATEPMAPVETSAAPSDEFALTDDY